MSSWMNGTLRGPKVSFVKKKAAVWRSRKKANLKTVTWFMSWICSRELPLQYWWGWWRWGEGSSWPSPGTCCEHLPEASIWRRTPGTSHSSPSSCCRRVGPLQPGTVYRRGLQGRAPAAPGRSLPSLPQTCHRKHTKRIWNAYDCRFHHHGNKYKTSGYCGQCYNTKKWW